MSGCGACKRADWCRCRSRCCIHVEALSPAHEGCSAAGAVGIGWGWHAWDNNAAARAVQHPWGFHRSSNSACPSSLAQIDHPYIPPLAPEVVHNPKVMQLAVWQVLTAALVPVRPLRLSSLAACRGRDGCKALCRRLLQGREARQQTPEYCLRVELFQATSMQQQAQMERKHTQLLAAPAQASSRPHAAAEPINPPAMLLRG